MNIIRETSDLATRLSTDVAAICFSEGRVVGSRGHARARKYLARRLSEIGCVPFFGASLVLPYEVDGDHFFNIVGVIPGRDRTLPALLIGAHYDSVIPYPCADDNAAAVAIALTVGAMASEAGGLERDLIIAIFDAEEPPHFLNQSMGSERFYEDQMGETRIHAALIMDLVGHDISVSGEMLYHLAGGLVRMIPGWNDKDFRVPSLHSMLFVTGAESHPELASVLEQAGTPRGLKVVPTLNAYVGDMSDHGIFRRNGVPYYFFSCGRWAHYHQPSDTPDRLNYRKMAAITTYAFDLMKHLDRRNLARHGRRERISETLHLETEYLKAGLGMLYPFFLRRIGISSIESRADMNRVVEGLLALGL